MPSGPLAVRCWAGSLETPSAAVPDALGYGGRCGRGGVAGQGVQGAMNKTQGVELEIRKDDGNTIMVVQNRAALRSPLVSASPCRQRQPVSPSLAIIPTMRPVAPHRIFSHVYFAVINS